MVQEWEDRITEWLDMSSYSDFILYYDEQYIYQAVVIEGPEFKGTRKTGNIVPFEFTVSIRPFKENYNGRFTIRQTETFDFITQRSILQNRLLN